MELWGHQGKDVEGGPDQRDQKKDSVTTFQANMDPNHSPTQSWKATNNPLWVSFFSTAGALVVITV